VDPHGLCEKLELSPVTMTERRVRTTAETLPKPPAEVSGLFRLLLVTAA